MEKTSVERNAKADDDQLDRSEQLGRAIYALMEAHRARTAVPAAASPQLPPSPIVAGAASPQLPPWARTGASSRENQLASVDSPGTSGTSAPLADRPDPSVLPQTASPSLTPCTTAIESDPPVAQMPSPSLAPSGTALLTDRPSPPVLPEIPSPLLAPDTAGLADQPNAQTPSPKLAPGDARLTDRSPVVKYFSAVGLVLAVLLIAVTYGLGPLSDGLFKDSRKTEVASQNPSTNSTNVGPRAPLSDSSAISSVDRSIDLPDGGETTGQTSQPQRSEPSIEGDKAIRSEAKVPLTRPRPPHTAAASPAEQRIGHAPQGARSPTATSDKPKRPSSAYYRLKAQEAFKAANLEPDVRKADQMRAYGARLSEIAEFVDGRRFSLPEGAMSDPN